MLGNFCSPDFVQVIHRGVETNNIGDIRSAGLEFMRNFVPGAAIKIDAGNHISSALVRRHLFEQIEAGRIKLDQKITISQRAADQAPTKLDLDPGEKIEVEDAIKALVTRSANDVAVAVAEAIAGDEEAFAMLMTRKARALGMKDTVFKNASGLPDKEQITTARDLASLGRAIQDRFPRLYRFFSMKTFLWRGEQIANHNRLINRDGVDGIKTGYTNASGYNLASSVNRDGRRLVAVWDDG